MLLFVLVESLSAGLDAALSGSQAARTLIVYRKNRYCPQTSFLPERYTRLIADVPGVASVLPVKVFLSNCRASLDIAAFQGAPVERLLATRDIELVAGSLASFEGERDAALLGREFATRRGFEVGDRFRIGSIDVKVAGVFASSQPVEEGVILTHLEYLQRAGPVDRLGTVTQFEVKVDDAANAEAIAKRIDGIFATAEEPTDTRSQLAFLETATRDLREILRFGRLLALACVAVVLALVANTIVMSVQERVRELGVLRTIGWRGGRLVALVVLEALAYALAGALLGLVAAVVLIRVSHLSIGAEGVPVAFVVSQAVVLRGLGLALLASLLAAVAPAVRVARMPIVGALRSA
jgi:putative ABC transport system permease protein